MDLQLGPEQLQLRDATRRLLAERLEALVKQLPEPPVPDTAQALRDAQALGWLGLGLPEDVGGAGSFEDLVVVHEELGRGLAPSLMTTLGVAARLVLHSDAGPGRDRLLAQLAEGNALLAPAGLGAEAAVTCTADRLTGVVRHVVDGRAVHALLLPTQHADGGTALARVATDAPGVRLVDESGATDLLHVEVHLQDAPAAVLARDAGPVLRAVRTEATVLAAARALGGGRAVLERTVQHVSTRHQFGRAIGTCQAVQHQLADVATALDAAGLAVARAAWAVDAGLADEQVDPAAAVAGLAAGEAFAQATLVAHQLHGGMGFVLDSPLHLWSARAVADPTAPRGRRHLLDALSATTGLAPAKA